MNKAHQGIGHGALMYQAVLKECRAQGYKFATGRVSVANLPMVNLLARLGFRIRSAVTTLHWFRPARQ
jgi:L-amino acid N-acyltransferase YncA